MITTFLEALIGFWRKCSLLRPPKPLQYLLYLWRALRASLSRKPPDENTRGGNLAKLIADRRPGSTENAATCASRIPPSTSPGFTNTTSVPVETPSHPASAINDFSSVPADVSTEAEPETPHGVVVDPQSSIHSRFKDKSLNPTLENDRYGRKICLPLKPDGYELKIPPMALDFSRKDVPLGWTACVHPEGALYFYHEARKIYTDANICDADQYEEIEAFATALGDLARRENITVPSDAEVVLDIHVEADGDTSWNYYYVDCPRRALFWLQEFDVTWQIPELLGQTSLPHYKYEIEYYYWTHIEYYPHGHHLGIADTNELIGILIHAVTDQLTSALSTVLFSIDTLNTMLSMAKEFKDFGSSDETVCMHGRLMYMFAHARFLAYHGQYGARLNREESVHSREPKSRSLLIKILAPFLWNAPYAHLGALEKIWVDQMVSIVSWKHFIQKLKDEWQEFTLYGTVLLNANVAFLALTNVDSGSGNNRTAAQIVSYISIAMSTGSVIIGLLLGHQNRVTPGETADQAAQSLMLKSPLRVIGMEPLSIVHSLPYALLMWGIATFLGAFSLECFLTLDRAAIYTSAVVWFLVGSLVVWCIYIGMEASDPLRDRLQRKVEAARDSSRTFLRKLFPGNSDNVAAPENDRGTGIV